MQIIDVNEDNFSTEVIQSELPVIVDFNADWCGPCQMLRPTLEDVAEEHDNFKIVSVNIDDNDALAEQYQIYSIPCLVVIKDGKETNRHVGVLPKSEIPKLLNQKPQNQEL